MASGADRLILYTDGAARGNPGPAAYGAVLTDARGKTLVEFARTIGAATNNEAEYRGLLAGLEAAQAQGAGSLEIRLDSELLVAQLNGDYRIRAANLKPLFEETQKRLKGFRRVRIAHIPRASNARADALANRALDGEKA